MNSRYALDRGNAKILGVCAGVARSIDYNVLVVRGVALMALILMGPIAIAFYLLAGWLAD